MTLSPGITKINEMTNGEKLTMKEDVPGDSKCPFHPLVGGHLTP